MPSIDEFSAAIGAAAESAEATSSAIGAAKANGDELAGQFSGIGADGKAGQTTAIAQRLESEAAAISVQLKSLLEEIRNQAEALSGLDTTSGASSTGSGNSAQPANTDPPLPPLIQQLGERLPPGGRGQQTIVFAYSDDDGSATQFSSGRDASARVGLKRAYQGLIIMDHAESHLAAAIRSSGPRLRQVAAVINNEPCKGPAGCDNVFADIIPAGTQVSLYVKSPAGLRLYGVYNGNGKAIA